MRERLHSRAADLLSERCTGPDAVAVHLLAISPRRNARTAKVLAAAARGALARGAPEAAAALLERALAEPAPVELQPQLVIELGWAEHLLQRPSERRIAERAAAGASNPAIAQALFVTVKTVEMHLSNAYRKLGISSRGELGHSLSE